MAISVVAHSNAAISTSRSPSLTFTGYTPALNDVVCFFPSSTSAGVTPTAPSGWVNPLGGTTDVESDVHELCIVYHLVTAAEVSGGTTTYTATNLYGATTTGNVVGAVVRGVDMGNIVDSINTGFSTANAATPHVLPALTGTNLSNNSLVLSCVAIDGTGTYASDPGGYTRVETQNTNQGKALWSKDALTTAGGDIAAVNVTPGSGDEYASITVAFGGINKVATLADTFATKDAAKWTWPAEADAVSGQAVLTPASAAAWIYLTSVSYFDLVASNFTAKAVQKLATNQSNAESGIQFRVSSGNLEGLYVTGANPGLLTMREQVAASNDDTTLTYDATAHKWLRIRESGGTVYWETSPTGDVNSWTTRRSKAAGLTLTSGQLRFYAGWASGTAPSPATAVFDDANLPPNSGTTSGAYTWAASATGEKTQNGTGSGAYTWAGSATGEAPVSIPAGTASGAYTFTLGPQLPVELPFTLGGAVGEKTSNGTTSGTYTWAASASGARASDGTAGGTYTWAASATGEKTQSGTASGAYTWAASASGAKAQQGAAGGGYTWAATSSGERASDGTTSGGYGWAGTASGEKTQSATASGAYAWAGAAAGEAEHKATASGGYAWTSSATGHAPAVGVSEGTAGGGYEWSATATGARASRGTVGGGYGWAASSTGARASSGTASGAYTWVGSAGGARPEEAIPSAMASGGYGWAATGSGRRTPKASIYGLYGWVGTATGDMPRIQTEPPAGRTTTIAAAPRLTVITAAPRAIAVTAAPRATTITAAPRTATVPAAPRETTVPARE